MPSENAVLVEIIFHSLSMYRTLVVSLTHTFQSLASLWYRRPHTLSVLPAGLGIYASWNEERSNPAPLHVTVVDDT